MLVTEGSNITISCLASVSNPSVQFMWSDSVAGDISATRTTIDDGVVPHNVHVWNEFLIISYYTDVSTMLMKQFEVILKLLIISITLKCCKTF